MDQEKNDGMAGGQVYCTQCGKKIAADAKFCCYCGALNGTVNRGCAAVEQNVQQKTEPAVANNSSTVTILGYKESFAVNPSVKIYINDVIVGKVGFNEQITLPVQGITTIVFKSSLRSATCQVRGGECVLLSFDRLTGGLSATVTDSANLQTVVVEKLQKDNKKWIIFVAIAATLLILKAIMRAAS